MNILKKIALSYKYLEENPDGIELDLVKRILKSDAYKLIEAIEIHSPCGIYCFPNKTEARKSLENAGKYSPHNERIEDMIETLKNHEK